MNRFLELAAHPNIQATACWMVMLGTAALTTTTVGPWAGGVVAGLGAMFFPKARTEFFGTEQEVGR